MTPVPLAQLSVHRLRVASFGRHVDDERGAAGERGELQGAAIQQRAAERVHARAAGAARHISPRKGGYACSAARGGAGGGAQHLGRSDWRKKSTRGVRLSFLGDISRQTFRGEV